MRGVNALNLNREGVAIPAWFAWATPPVPAEDILTRSELALYEALPSSKRRLAFLQGRYCAKAATSEKTAGGRVEAHRTTKPLELVEWLVRLVTPPAGRVLDQFVGSGTTLIACERLGFDSVGIELREEAAEQARKRIALMTEAA